MNRSLVRNDTFFCKECGTRPARAGPYGRTQEAQYKAGRGVGDAAPYEWDGGTDCHSQCAHWLRNDRFLQGVQWAGDRKGRPYGSVARSAWRRETARVAPTERGELIILIFRKERCVWS